MGGSQTPISAQAPLMTLHFLALTETWITPENSIREVTTLLGSGVTVVRRDPCPCRDRSLTQASAKDGDCMLYVLALKKSIV